LVDGSEVVVMGDGIFFDAYWFSGEIVGITIDNAFSDSLETTMEVVRAFEKEWNDSH
jgi:hypothetical protein